MNLPDETLSFAPFYKAITSGRDIKAVLEVISGCLGAGAAFREEFTGRISIISSSEEFSESAKTFPTLEMRRIYLSKDVQIGNLHSGILFFDIPLKTKLLSPEQEIFIDNAAIAAALSLDRSLALPKPENAKRDEVLKGFLSGDPHYNNEAEKFFSEHGWGKKQSCFVLLFQPAENGDFSDRERRLLFTFAQNKVLSFFPKSLSVYMAGTLAFIIPCSAITPENAEETEKILKTVSVSLKEELPFKKNLPFFFAAGGIKKSSVEISQSFNEAVKAVRFSEAIKNDTGVVMWDMLGSYQLLAMLSGAEEARLFCFKVLGELIVENTPSSREFLKTLAVMDMCNWNIKSASRSLRFHYNTIKYRLGIIRDRISFDYNDPAQRFEMSLALRLAPFFTPTNLLLCDNYLVNDLAE